MELTGPRLRLRPWREADRAPFAALNADPGVMRYFAAPLNRAESDAFLDRLQARIAAEGWGFWCVERHAQPGCIGMVGLQPIPWDAPFTPAVEIGWRIATAAQRQGYAAEAARLALAAGFGPLGLAAILAFTVPANAPSWRLMEKLGMTPAGHFAHPRLPAGHLLSVHALYRLQRADWLRGAGAAG